MDHRIRLEIDAKTTEVTEVLFPGPRAFGFRSLTPIIRTKSVGLPAH